MVKTYRLIVFLIVAGFFIAPHFVIAADATISVTKGDNLCEGKSAGDLCNHLHGQGVCIVSSGTDNGLACFLQTQTIPGTSGSINTFYLQGYANSIVGIINGLLVPVLMAVAFIVFLWGVYSYFILGSDNEEKRITGRQFVLWSIIGFAIIFSVWGLVGIVGSTFGLAPGGMAPGYPTL